MVFRALLRLKGTKDSTPLYWLTYHLAIAPQPWRHEWQAIHAAGIRCVVDLRSQTQDDTAALTSLNMTFRHLPIVDGEATEQATLLELTDWILEQQASQGPVLVHCREGRGRSAMVGCAVLIRMGVPLSEAYRVVRHARGQHVSLSDEQVEALEVFAKLVVQYPRWRQERGA
jgi:protein tyrosine phosphatase (PTP) superfamily phosphohydrolase (DUF442 family)